MKYLKRLYEELERQCGLHADEIYNYAVPQSWNLYGYRPAKSIRSKELLVHPYEFYLFTLRHILKDADGNWNGKLKGIDDYYYAKRAAQTAPLQEQKGVDI